MRAGATSKPGTVSLVIANHNYGRFLPQCLEAVFAQTSLPEQIIIIDDASSDGSQALIAGFADRARIILNPVNLGIVDCFNKAAGITTEDYVVFLGADNVPERTFISRCRAALDSSSDCAIAYTDLLVFGPMADSFATRVAIAETQLRHPTYGPSYEWRFPDFTDALGADIARSNFIHGSSLYRRAVFEAVGGYRSSDTAEDHDLFTRMLGAGWKAVHVPEPLLAYRQHSADQANTALDLRRELASVEERVARLSEQVADLQARYEGSEHSRVRSEVVLRSKQSLLSLRTGLVAAAQPLVILFLVGLFALSG